MSRPLPPPPAPPPRGQGSSSGGSFMNRTGGVDPISLKTLTPDQVYARDGNVVFESLQTQSAYYRMLEQGFVVVMENGQPKLEKGKMERVWELQTSEGMLARLTSWTDLPAESVTAVLTEGRYEFQAVAPELMDSFLAGTKRRVIHVEIDVKGANGQNILAKFQVDLSAEQNEITIPFQVAHNQAPATARMNFKSPSTFHKLMVKSSINKRVASQKSEGEAIKARQMSQKIMRGNEFLVELEKDAKGVGMTFKWDVDRHGMVVKSIDPIGVAARSKIIKVGDIIRAVQGVRVDALDFRDTQEMLRNVPIRIVLVLEHAPSDWQGFRAPAPLPGAAAAGAASAPAPPPRGSSGQQVGGGPAPPPRPPRQGSSAAGLGGPVPPPRPPRQGAAALPTAPAAAVSEPPAPPPRLAPPAPLARPPPAAPQHPLPPPPPVAAAAVAATAVTAATIGKRPPPPRPPVPGSHPAAAPPKPAPPTPPPHVVAPPSAVPAMDAAAVPIPPPKPAAVPPPRRAAAPRPPTAAAVEPPQVSSVAAPVPVATPSEAELAPRASPSAEEFGPEYAKYVKMKRAGLPDGAIINAMNRDGVQAPPGFFPDNFNAPKPVQIKVTAAAPAQSSAESSASRAPSASGGGGLLDALKRFDAGKLKHRDESEAAAPEAAPSPSRNPLMAELEKKAKGGLRKRSQEEMEEDERRKVDIAAKGKSMFNEALLKKFENANPVEEEDEDNGEWSDFEM